MARARARTRQHATILLDRSPFIARAHVDKRLRFRSGANLVLFCFFLLCAHGTCVIVVGVQLQAEGFVCCLLTPLLKQIFAVAVGVDCLRDVRCVRLISASLRAASL